MSGSITRVQAGQPAKKPTICCWGPPQIPAQWLPMSGIPPEVRVSDVEWFDKQAKPVPVPLLDTNVISGSATDTQHGDITRFMHVPVQDRVKPISAVELNVTISVENTVILTETRIKFYNPNDRKLRAKVSFPVDGTLVEFAAQNEMGILMPAVAVPKAKAAAVTEKEERAGRSVSLAKTVIGNMHEISAYPIPGKGYYDVTITFASSVKFHSRKDGPRFGFIPIALPRIKSAGNPPLVSLTINGKRLPPNSQSEWIGFPDTQNGIALNFANDQDQKGTNFVSLIQDPTDATTKFEGQWAWRNYNSVLPSMLIVLHDVPEIFVTVAPPQIRVYASGVKEREKSHYFCVTRLLEDDTKQKIVISETKSSRSVAIVIDTSESQAAGFTLANEFTVRLAAEYATEQTSIELFQWNLEGLSKLQTSRLSSSDALGDTSITDLIATAPLLKSFGEIYLITDGIWTRGSSSQYPLFVNALQRNVVIHTINTTMRKDVVALKNMTRSGGRMFDLTDPNAARDAAAKSCVHLSAPLAEQVSISIDAHSNSCRNDSKSTTPPGGLSIPSPVFSGVVVDRDRTDCITIVGRHRVAGSILINDSPVEIPIIEEDGEQNNDEAMNPEIYELEGESVLPLLWSMMTLQQLERDPRKNAKAIARLARINQLGSSQTSLLVLQTVDQFVEHDILPPKANPEMRKQFLARIPKPSTDKESPLERLIRLYQFRDEHAIPRMKLAQTRAGQNVIEEKKKRDEPKKIPKKCKGSDAENWRAKDGSGSGSVAARCRGGSGSAAARGRGGSGSVAARGKGRSGSADEDSDGDWESASGDSDAGNESQRMTRKFWTKKPGAPDSDDETTKMKKVGGRSKGGARGAKGGSSAEDAARVVKKLNWHETMGEEIDRCLSVVEDAEDDWSPPASPATKASRTIAEIQTRNTLKVPLDRPLSLEASDVTPAAAASARSLTVREDARAVAKAAAARTFASSAAAAPTIAACAVAAPTIAACAAAATDRSSDSDWFEDAIRPGGEIAKAAAASSNIDPNNNLQSYITLMNPKVTRKHPSLILPGSAIGNAGSFLPDIADIVNGCLGSGGIAYDTPAAKKAAELHERPYLVLLEATLGRTFKVNKKIIDPMVCEGDAGGDCMKYPNTSKETQPKAALNKARHLYYHQLKSEYGNRRGFHFDAAIWFIGNGDIDMGCWIALSILDLNPECRESWEQAIYALITARAFSEAQEVLSMLLQMHPTSTHLRFALANALVDQELTAVGRAITWEPLLKAQQLYCEALVLYIDNHSHTYIRLQILMQLLRLRSRTTPKSGAHPLGDLPMTLARVVGYPTFEALMAASSKEIAQGTSPAIAALGKHDLSKEEKSKWDSLFYEPMATAAFRVQMAWNTDLTDQALWVVDSEGRHVSYNSAAQGGNSYFGDFYHDFTRGYGPEEAIFYKVVPGSFRVSGCNWTQHNSVSDQPDTTSFFTIYTNYGLPNETVRYRSVRLICGQTNGAADENFTAAQVVHLP
jgi:hypothetical protein